MARRYRRDLIGHFIRRDQRTQQMCTHACCRGYWFHPDNSPVILPNRLLRQASDEDLADHFHQVAGEDTPNAHKAEAQIIYEMERRDRASLECKQRRIQREERHRQHREAVKAARAARRMEREAETGGGSHRRGPRRLASRR